MADLHDELPALRVDWPATPDLAERGAARLERRAGAAPPRAWRPALAYGLAALAAAFALTMAVSPDARSAVLEWLGLKSVEVERREPTAPPPRPGTLGAGLGLGTPVTLARGAPALAVPARAGGRRARRARRHLRRRATASRSSTASAPATRAPTRPAPRCSCSSSRARVGPVHPEDGRRGREPRAPPRRRRPRVLHRRRHGFAYEDEGAVDFEDQRIAGNTLLVERADGLLMRVEGDLARDRAVAIARLDPVAQRWTPNVGESGL